MELKKKSNKKKKNTFAKRLVQFNGKDVDPLFWKKRNARPNKKNESKRKYDIQCINGNENKKIERIKNEGLVKRKEMNQEIQLFFKRKDENIFQ